MLLARGRMGTDEEQRSGMSRRHPRKRRDVHLTSFLLSMNLGCSTRSG
jgi:hypothetical protein